MSSRVDRPGPKQDKAGLSPLARGRVGGLFFRAREGLSQTMDQASCCVGTEPSYGTQGRHSGQETLETVTARSHSAGSYRSGKHWALKSQRDSRGASPVPCPLLQPGVVAGWGGGWRSGLCWRSPIPSFWCLQTWRLGSSPSGTTRFPFMVTTSCRTRPGLCLGKNCDSVAGFQGSAGCFI